MTIFKYKHVQLITVRNTIVDHYITWFGGVEACIDKKKGNYNIVFYNHKTLYSTESRLFGDLKDVETNILNYLKDAYAKNNIEIY